MITDCNDIVTISESCLRCGKQVDLHIHKPCSWLLTFKMWVGDLGGLCKECWEGEKK